ncbi:MAG: TspO/MBR family protein [Woeseiaceae bacterium]|nr:TspO/MBR family protein [Woeseiaceae bacterium]
MQSETLATATSRRNSALGLAGWLVVCAAAWAAGAIASIEAGLFYGQLVQPSWAPPPWLFGPVWTLLFAMMAAAAWLVWRAGGFRAHRTALSLFLLQLVFNGLWSWLFFAWRLGGIAFVEILLLWILIAATVLLFWRASPVAGALLAPYLLWVSFASILNFSLWRLNPDIFG